MAELKPCPFCGGFAWVYEHTCIKNRPTYYTTHCKDCGVSDLKHHKSASEAIEAWNRRAANTPCDLCRFNPPSSFDGKPCTLCVAYGGADDGK